MNHIEALKLALEALESYKDFIEDAHILEGQWHWIDGADKAITAIKQAINDATHLAAPVACVACEGNPKGDNIPCAICKTTPPAAAKLKEKNT
jgi:hypothetical protein